MTSELRILKGCQRSGQVRQHFEGELICFMLATVIIILTSSYMAIGMHLHSDIHNQPPTSHSGYTKNPVGRSWLWWLLVRVSAALVFINNKANLCLNRNPNYLCEKARYSSSSLCILMRYCKVAHFRQYH